MTTAAETAWIAALGRMGSGATGVAQRLVDDGGDGGFGSGGDVGRELRFSMEFAHGLFVSECGVEFVGVAPRLMDDAVELVGDGGDRHCCQVSPWRLAIDTVC